MNLIRAKNRPVTFGLIALVTGVVLMVAGVVVPLLTFSYVRSNLAEDSTETFTVPAGEDLVIPVESMDGRFEYIFSSDSAIDFYMLNDEDVPKYKADQGFFVLDQAKDVQYWDTFVQTGVGLDFALVFLNPGVEETSVILRETFFPNPPTIIIQGSLILVPFGVLLALGGGLMLLVGILPRIRRKQST